MDQLVNRHGNMSFDSADKYKTNFISNNINQKMDVLLLVILVIILAVLLYLSQKKPVWTYFGGRLYDSTITTPEEKIYLCYYVAHEYKDEIKKLKTDNKNIKIISCIGDKIPVDQFIHTCAEKIKPLNVRIIFFYAGHAYGYYLRQNKKRIPIYKVRRALEILQPIMCVFDSCVMSCLEALYELKDCTKYILGCEGYGSNNGFLTKNTIEYLEEYRQNDDPVLLGKRLLDDGYKQNDSYDRPWNGSLCDMKQVSSFVYSLQNPSEKMRFIYANYALVDVGSWFNKDTSSVIIHFRKNSVDCCATGISFISFISTKDIPVYAECQLYKDISWVRDIHSRLDYDKRVLEANYSNKQLKKESEADEIVYKYKLADNEKIIYESTYSDGIIKHIKNTH